MATAASLTLDVWRNDDVYEFPLRVRGPDLTGAAMRAQVRLAPDTPGAPLIDLALTTNGNAEGIRLAGVSTVDGVITNDVRIRLNKSTRQALPYAGETGDAAVLAFAFQIAGRTRLFGALRILASAIDSDAAPAGRPPGYGARITSAPSGGASLTIADDDVVALTIDGADLIGPLVDDAASSADRSESAAARVEGLGSQIIPLGNAATTTNIAPTAAPNASDGETIYSVTLPAGFDANVNGRRFSIIIPDDALSATVRLKVDGVGVRDVFFPVGTKLRKGWQAFFQVNTGGNKFNFERTIPDGATFTEVERRLTASYSTVSALLGVQFALPISGNPNEAFIPNAPLQNDVAFEAIITATNTDDMRITNAQGQRRAVVGAFADVVKAGTIATFQYSGGFSNFVYIKSRPLPTIGAGETAPEIWSGFDDVLAVHYGDVVQGSNGKPVFTPRLKRIVGRGSSVVTDPGSRREGAAPPGQAPVAVLARVLSAAHGPGNTFYADNWSHGGHVQSQAESQWAEAMSADQATPVWMLLDGFGMNDMQMSAYNGGQLSPLYYGNPIYCEAEIRARLDGGVQYYVMCTSPHDNTDKQTYDFGGNSMGWPYAKPAPVAADEIVPPFNPDPALNKSITPEKDWTGREILRRGNARGEHVNELMRKIIRKLHNDPKYRGRVFLLDAEWAWFRYGVERYTLTDLFGPNEIVHPQLLGHQVSYQRCIREFVAASRRGFGDQWCFRGELAG